MNAKKLLDFIKNNEDVAKSIKHFKSGEVVFYEGDLCKDIVIVLNGEIKMSTIIENSDVTFNIAEKYDIFGNNLIYASDNRYRGTLSSTSKTKLLIINKKDLDVLMNDIEFRNEYLKILADSTLLDKKRLRLLQIPYLEDRLNELFKEQDNVISFKSISNLAYFLSTSRENLSRLLHQLEKEGKLIIHQHYLENTN